MLDLEEMRQRADLAKRFILAGGNVHGVGLADDNLALVDYVERLRDVIAGLTEGEG
jgi:hypothetical protein